MILQSGADFCKIAVMKIFVKAKPSAREESVKKISETNFSVSVKEPPRNGMANGAIARAIAAHFGVPQSRVKLVSGYSSRQKVFEIEALPR